MGGPRRVHDAADRRGSGWPPAAVLPERNWCFPSVASLGKHQFHQVPSETEPPCGHACAPLDALRGLGGRTYSGGVLRVLLVVALLAGSIYLVFWSLERRRAAGRAQRQHPSARRPTRRQPPRFVAPDDDEDFLRDLERKRRQEDGPG